MERRAKYLDTNHHIKILKKTALITAPTAIYTVPLGLLAALSMKGFPKVDGGVMVGTIIDEDNVFELETEAANDGRLLEVVWDATLEVDLVTAVELAVVVASFGRSLLTRETDGMKFFLAISADVSFWILQSE